jgi:hypothetical protein
MIFPVFTGRVVGRLVGFVVGLVEADGSVRSISNIAVK